MFDVVTISWIAIAVVSLSLISRLILLVSPRLPYVVRLGYLLMQKEVLYSRRSYSSRHIIMLMWSAFGQL